MKILRNSVSGKIETEIIEMTEEEIIKLLLSGEQFIVHKPDYKRDYDLDIMNYDGYVE